MKTAAVVIPYYPSAELVRNILSYLNAVSMLIIVDNSPEPLAPSILTTLQKVRLVQYIHKPQNIGVAAALNLGAAIAMEKRCSHLLTMDQDSRFHQDDFARFMRLCELLPRDKLGIAAPCRSTQRRRRDTSDAPRKITMTMTSGSLLNLQAYTDCGAFDEDLFIDHVDHEYCLRLSSRGWEVWEIPSVILDHQLGRKREISIFGKRVLVIISHNPLRDYYVVRNGLLVARRYRGQRGVAHIKRCVLEVVVKAAFFETERIQRFRWLIRAFKDYRLNITGKIG